MEAAKKAALKSIATDANAARLGDRLPETKREKLRLMKLIKEELKKDEADEDAETDADSED